MVPLLNSSSQFTFTGLVIYKDTICRSQSCQSFAHAPLIRPWKQSWGHPSRENFPSKVRGFRRPFSQQLIFSRPPSFSRSFDHTKPTQTQKDPQHSNRTPASNGFSTPTSNNQLPLLDAAGSISLRRAQRFAAQV